MRLWLSAFRIASGSIFAAVGSDAGILARGSEALARRFRWSWGTQAGILEAGFAGHLHRPEVWRG